MPIASITVAGIIVPNNPRKIKDSEVDQYKIDGWQIKPDEIIQEQVEMSAPVIVPEPAPYVDDTQYGVIVPVVPVTVVDRVSNVEKLEKAMNQKRRGRPSKR